MFSGAAFAGPDQLIPIGQFHAYDYYTDVWGYAAADGTELALLGTAEGLSVIDVSDPESPREVGFIPGPATVASDIKTHREYAYLVNNNARVLQVVSLVDPQNPVEVGSARFLPASHNLFIDEEAGLLYGVRPSRELQVWNLADPAQPVEVGAYPFFYHDLHVRAGRAYGLDPTDASLQVLDVSQPPAISLLHRVSFPVLYAHGGWPTADGRYFLATDESRSGHLHVFDLLDPTGPREVAHWSNPFDSEASVHNVVIRDETAYVSWYTSGLFALDVHDPADPVLLAHFDTYPGSGFAFDGVFGIYPDLPSGIILASDMSTGLWIFRHQPGNAEITIVAWDRQDDRPIAGATVEFTGREERPDTDAAGRATVSLPEGVYRVRITHPEFTGVEEEIVARRREESTHTFALRGAVSGQVVAEPSLTRETTRLRFVLPGPGSVRVQILDAGGRVVREVWHGRLDAGLREISWDGRDRDGRAVASGLYLAQVSGPRFAATTRVLIIR